MKKETLPTLLYKTKSDSQKFGGHWFRGKDCNFIPSKKHFNDKDFFEKYILEGLKPEKPFISKKHNILAFGSCFASEVSTYLADKNYSIFNKKYSTDAHIIRYGEGMANTFTVLEQLLWAFENNPETYAVAVDYKRPDGVGRPLVSTASVGGLAR